MERIAAVIWTLGMVVVGSAAERQGLAVTVRTAGTNEFSLSDGSQPWKPLKVGTTLTARQRVRTAEKGGADFVLTTRSIIRLAGESELEVEKLTQETKGVPPEKSEKINQTLLNFGGGEMMASVCEQTIASAYRVRTPAGVAEMRSAEYAVWKEKGKNRLCLRVLRGKVIFHIGGRKVELQQNQQLCADFDPAGTVSGEPQPMESPKNDAVSQRFEEFKRMTETLEHVVCHRDEVDIGRALETAGISPPPPPPPPPPEISPEVP